MKAPAFVILKAIGIEAVLEGKVMDINNFRHNKYAVGKSWELPIWFSPYFPPDFPQTCRLEGMGTEVARKPCNTIMGKKTFFFSFFFKTFEGMRIRKILTNSKFAKLLRSANVLKDIYLRDLTDSGY